MMPIVKISLLRVGSEKKSGILSKISYVRVIMFPKALAIKCDINYFSKFSIIEPDANPILEGTL